MTLSPFESIIVDAIENDKFVVALVESDVEGKYRNDGTPFGAGKTTIAMQLAHRFAYYEPGFSAEKEKNFLDIGINSPDNPQSWDPVFAALWYWPKDIFASLRQADHKGKRIKAGVWDAVQASAPAKQGTDQALVNLVGMLSDERPAIAFLLLTAPSMKSIASPIREMVKYELIVHQRGLYEVQMSKKKKNWHNPSLDRIQLKGIEGIDEEGARELGLDINDFRVPRLVPEVKERYEKWRSEMKDVRFAGLSEQLERHDTLVKFAEKEDKTDKAEAGRSLAQMRWGKGK